MTKGDLIAKVHEMKTVVVEIAIPEKEIADVKVGYKVVLKAQAYPQAQFEGSVAGGDQAGGLEDGAHHSRHDAT